jgi:hypothetical protein
VLSADNGEAGDPPLPGGDNPAITIPVFGVTLAVGALLRAAVADGVQVQIGIDRSSLAGADAQGRVRMYAPRPAQPGSSIAHFDNVAAPNLLMEPAINRDVGQRLDLTDDLLRGIGWFGDRNYNAVDDCAEVQLALTKALAPLGLLRNGDLLTIMIDVRNSGLIGDATVRLANQPPSELTEVTWSAAYSGGASGPALGVAAIDTLLVLPPGSGATLTITAVLQTAALNDVVNVTEATAQAAPAADCPSGAGSAQIVIPVAAHRLNIPLVR